MKISAKEWILFILIAILCLGLWYKFEYPYFAFVDLSVNRNEELLKAEAYLKSRGINTEKYLNAAVFIADTWSDRYLQKTVGVKSEEEFIRKHNYELFFWKARFFKELQKEEFSVMVSPKSGSILGFEHSIEDTEPRETIEKEVARRKVEEFLQLSCGLNLRDYDFHEEKVKRYDRRVDYDFSWEKKGVYIPWGKERGGAKLLIGATVSGNEIREFHKNALDIPEKFRRFIENQLTFGQYLSTFAFVLSIIFLGAAVYVVAKKKNNTILRLSKNWFIYSALFIAIINLVNFLNNIQEVIIGYPTTSSLAPFIGLISMNLVISIFFFSVSFILPGMAGESLCSESLPKNKYSCFLHYLKSTFFCRSITNSIILGYLLFFIILGFQAVIFYFGQRYLGVWKEWMKLTQLSSSYLPFVSAFTIGTTASLKEEVLYRLFGISWLKKYFKNTILAVIISSLIWGLSHSAYAIFPVWFRGIEVSLIGFLLGFIFIRYGIIPLVIAHYLIDVFWGIAAYLFGNSPKYLFMGSLLTLAIPLIFAIMAYFVNKEEKERDIEIMLNKIEKYNLNILISFVAAQKSIGQSAGTIKEELLDHNWDIILIDLAIKEAFKN